MAEKVKKKRVKPIKDFSKLKITGAFNSDIYQTLSKDEIKEYVIKDVEGKVKKKIPEHWTKNVTIRCEYSIVNTVYSVVGMVKAAFHYKRSEGLTFEDIDYGSSEL